jgi:hypothetical protein
MVTWYEFKSTSTSHAVMTRDHFCGLRPGPRTIFTVDACRAYSIEKFSIFQGMDSEYEVLFRPLSQFRVVHATKNIVDPTERDSPERSGFPDAVGLIQIDEAPPPPPQPAGAAAQGVVGAAQGSIVAAQRLLDDIERLVCAGYARRDCEQALRMCENNDIAIPRPHTRPRPKTAEAVIKSRARTWLPPLNAYRYALGHRGNQHTGQHRRASLFVGQCHPRLSAVHTASNWPHAIPARDDIHSGRTICKSRWLKAHSRRWSPNMVTKCGLRLSYLSAHINADCVCCTLRPICDLWPSNPCSRIGCSTCHLRSASAALPKF